VEGSVPLPGVENYVVSHKQNAGRKLRKTFKIPGNEKTGGLSFDQRIELSATGTGDPEGICARISLLNGSLFQRGFFMFLLIVIVVVSTSFLIGIYQLMLHKYYWGPSGKPPNPKKNDERSS
jgi:hypothetical protein